MKDIELAQNKLKQFNQEEILSVLNDLNEIEKEKLVEQILKINFEEITNLYKNLNIKQELESSDIQPIEVIDKEKISDDEKKELEELGLNIIKQNQYAVVTMAGGQGTRLGWSGPKGTFKLANGKYIFEILAEKFKKCENQYGTYPYWYIMTSEENNDDTVDFFEEHNYFGLDKDKVKFFKQDKLPMLTPEGKMIIENNKIKTASNGNGGVYLSLQKEKMLEDMRKKNVKWVYLCGVDNIMVKPIDPIFIGLTVKKNMDIASKAIVKNYPDEKVGAFCKRNGKPDVIEYIELSEEMKNAKDENGNLKYGDSGFISHLFSIVALEKCPTLYMSYHLAVKNNLYKFESFYFDVFRYFDDMLVMRVKREEEFAPIKNKEGVDSPETALAIYEKKGE